MPEQFTPGPAADPNDPTDPTDPMGAAPVDASADRTAGARRADRSSRWLLRRPGTPVGGRRIRAPYRRAHGLPGTVGVTVMGAVLPGSGYLWTGRRKLGAAVLVAWIAITALVVVRYGRSLRAALDLAFDPTELRIVAALVLAALVVWAVVVVTSYVLARPRERPRVHTAVGNAVVVLVVLAVGAPLGVVVRDAYATASTVGSVLKSNPVSPTIPHTTAADPWGGRDRVNVLLLGGDGGDDRTGVRTDSVILASMDTRTGSTILFSLPRNMEYAEFPTDSPLHKIYPDGYGRGGTLDPSFYMLNAIYGQVPADYPHILGRSDNEGADAIKEAVSGSLGIPVDYYMLVDFTGFREVVDAMGGITVNVNEPVAINGQTDAHIPPTGYIQPGPDKHLNGYLALWYARGRYGSDDYQRMDRQRCAIDALVKAAQPTTLLTHYVALAKAGQHLVKTDIPRSLGPAFVQLLLKTKDAKIRSVVFRRSDAFDPSDPDFDYVHQVVAKAIDPPKSKHTHKRKQESEVENPVDACAYHPVTGTGTTDATTSAAGTTDTGSTTGNTTGISSGN